MTRTRRRDVLGMALALASGALAGNGALAASGCAPRGPRRVPDGELLDPGMALGHRVRDAGVPRATPPPADAPILDVVIAGGGVAGLAAAWRLRARGIDSFELCELADVEGGTARSGASALTAYPWGAHYVTTPLADDTLMTGLLHEVGALEGVDEHGHPRAAEAFACREPDERLFVADEATGGGRFLEGLAPVELLDDLDRRDFARFEALLDDYAALIDGAGRHAFALPRAQSSTDAALLALDRLSFRDWLLAHGLVSQRLHWLCDYAMRDDDGVSLEQASAWAGLFYFCARRRPGVAERSVITRPDGNGFLVRHLAKASAGRRVCHEAVVDVRPAGDVVDVVTMDLAGTLRTRRARHVIVAVPRFVAARIVQPLRERPPPWLSHFTNSAWVVANVHLSGRPRVVAGVPFAWDTVIEDSESLGFIDASHQSGRDHGPTVWTWYRPLLDNDGRSGRAALYAGDRAHWADACLTDLERAFPEVRGLATRVDVCRWGHAMIRPIVGLFSSGALAAAALPVGNDNIHFAHTDLSGMALCEEALFHGARAADDVMARLSGLVR